MPICIHCATPIDSLYMRYGQDHIVLSPCRSSICSPPSKGRAEAVVLADEYLEHDLPVVVIDLMLAKPRAYRHLLFNRGSLAGGSEGGEKERGSGWGWGGELGAVARRVLAMGLVDAYIRWFYLCVQPASSSSFEAAGRAESRLSGRLAGWLQGRLPLQAGIFFPSSFTPPAYGVGWNENADGAIKAVCSATPIWTNSKGEAGSTMPTLVSYLNVLLVTLVEAVALHLFVAVLTQLAVRSLSPTHPAPSAADSTTKKHAPPSAPASSTTPPQPTSDPLLACKALLLSQLSPLLLLTFVLLWSTKFPHSTTPLSAEDRAWMVWIIRTFLASLNGGVAIATVLPNARGRWWPPVILGLAWAVQAAVSARLYRALS